jgi:hypothetical protein
MYSKKYFVRQKKILEFVKNIQIPCKNVFQIYFFYFVDHPVVHYGSGSNFLSIYIPKPDPDPVDNFNMDADPQHGVAAVYWSVIVLSLQQFAVVLHCPSCISAHV